MQRRTKGTTAITEENRKKVLLHMPHKLWLKLSRTTMDAEAVLGKSVSKNAVIRTALVKFFEFPPKVQVRFIKQLYLRGTNERE